MGIYSGPRSIVEGLIFAIDAGNITSYSGAGTTVVDVSRISASTSLQSGVGYFNTSPKGYFEFDGSNDNIPVTLTNFGTTTTIEVWMRMKAFTGGMPFGFNNYDIWTGGGGNGTLGYNTAAGDSYGLTSTQVTNLGLLNRWKHYIFEMRSDVSYTNNKIYIDGQSQTLSQIGGTENASNRNFNSGAGRISSWLFDNNYHQLMDMALFRVYNRALTQAEITNNFNSLQERFGYLENPVADGLVLYLDPGKYASYPGTGTSWYDLSGSNNHTTIINGGGYAYRNLGQILFDGTNDYANVNNNANILSKSAYTKFAFFTNSTYVVGNNIISGDAGSAHAFFMQTANKLYAGHNGNWSTITSNTSLVLNTWYSAALTFDTTSGFKLYVNGTLDNTNGTTTAYTGNDNCLIGAYIAGSNVFAGNMGVVMVYTKALTSSEVLQNHNAFKQRYGLP
jgi:hypothetical protein